MRCKTCNRQSWFSAECKNCEADRLERWRKEHTFVFGESVEVLQHDGSVFAQGKVTGEGIESSSFGYFVIPYYSVELPNGTIEKYECSDLKKVKKP